METFRREVSVALGPADTPEGIAAVFGDSTAQRRLKAKGQATIQTWPLSEEQLRSFLMRLDLDRNGKVEYRDFVLSIFVRDRIEDAEALRLGREPTVWFEHAADLWSGWGGDNDDESVDGGP